MQAAVIHDSNDRDLKFIEQDKLVKPIFATTVEGEAKLGMENGHGTKPFVCQVCKVSFTRLENLKRHMQKHKKTEKFKCHICNKEFSRKDTLKQHMRRQHPVENDLLVNLKGHKPAQITSINNNTEVEKKLEQAPNPIEEFKQTSMWRSYSEPGIVGYTSPGACTAESSSSENLESPSFLQTNFQEEEISVILQNYWTYFHPYFPLIHRPTFDHRKYNWILVNAMCAVGSLHVPHLKTHSAILCENTLKSIHETINSTGLSIEIVQAALILTFYGTYTDRIWFKRARALHTRLVAVARETGIFQSNPHDKFDDKWTSFIASEGRKRTSCCLYMVDSQMAILLNYPPSLSHYEVKHVLPCPDEIWEAETAVEWEFLCSQNFITAHGIHFLTALQQTLMYGRCPKHMSSFGSLTVLMAIHIMIRNMAQYSGVLEVPAINANDPFSRKSQLGDALNALRTLLPKKLKLHTKNEPKSMWEIFAATWNLAYIHLHIPDPVITSGIVEVTLPATIATAAALTKPQTINSPGNSLLSNNFKFMSFETLSIVVYHVCYFLKLAKYLKNKDVEKSPVFTFMFYKASLVAWQILNNGVRNNRNEEEDRKENVQLEMEYIRRRLIDDIINCVDEDDIDENDADELERFERWIREVLLCANTWSVGLAASASFYF